MSADPSPEEGEILVSVAAAGLNYIDTYQRGGLYPMDLPFTPGLEGAGSVLEIGAGVEGHPTRRSGRMDRRLRVVRRKTCHSRRASNTGPIGDRPTDRRGTASSGV